MSFDLVAMVVKTLVEGVAAAAKDTTTQVVKDGFYHFHSWFKNKFSDNEDVLDTLELVEKKPNEDRQKLLKKELLNAGAGQDAELLKQTQNLLTLLQEHGFLPVFQFDGNGAIAQGPGAVAAGQGGNAAGRDMHFHGDFYQGPPPRNADEALSIYRKVLFQTCGDLPLRGIDVEASDPTGSKKCLDLAQVYIDLDTQTQIPVEEEKKTRKRQAVDGQEPRPLSLLEATAWNRRLVILGDPGSGKTTFLNHLTLCLVGHGLEPQAGWLQRLAVWPNQEADILPVQVVLRDFARWLPLGVTKAKPCHLWDFVAERLRNQNLETAVEPLLKALEKGLALVMLDGLDEIPDQARRTLVRESVHAFADRYRDVRMLVTCRTLSYEEDSEWRLEHFPEFKVAPLDEKKIDGFVAAWYQELVRLKRIKSNSAPDLATQFQRAIRNSNLLGLARNPLLLTVMALVHTHKGRLPEARALLYEETVDILLSHWEQIKTDGEEETPRLRALLLEAERTDVDLKRALWHIAYQAHQSGGVGEDGVADIGELSLEKTLAKLHPDKDHGWAQKLIQTMKLRAGLLLERKPEVFSFPHRTFQEYLAGAYLSSQSGFARQAKELIAEGAVWREVILLAVGRLVYLSGDIDKPIALVGELCPDREPTDEVGWRGVWIAGEILVEMGLNRVNERTLGQELAVRVRKRLAALLGGGHLTPVERAAAGRALARLDDPRFREDVGYLPDEPLLGFVEIPAGPFWMGSDKNHDSSAEDDELPQHEVTLPAFFISRYPVTVAQFQAFVEAGGYAEPDYWPEAKAAGVWREGEVKGRFDNEARSRSERFGDPFELANHPVVGITWYEALAYCRWLTVRLQVWETTPEPFARLLRKEGWKVGLPGEAQWEMAARGCDGRIYPWGESFDAERTNCEESGIGSSCAVGSFPQGESPFGLMDMSGNVWEWCATKWRKDYKDVREDNSPEGKDARVLRGGSFLYIERSLRCSYRHRNAPSTRDDHLGFRVVVAPEGFAGL